MSHVIPDFFNFLFEKKNKKKMSGVRNFTG